jgi:hypothetical protein
MDVMLRQDESWQERAACIGDDMFTRADNPRDARDLFPICRRACPVIGHCRRYAVLTRSTGVWGGMWFENGKTAPPRQSRRP